MPEQLKEPINRTLASSLQDIQRRQKQIEEIDKANWQKMVGLNNPLSTIPGLGLVLSAGMLREIGNIRNFPGDDAVA